MTFDIKAYYDCYFTKVGFQLRPLTLLSQLKLQLRVVQNMFDDEIADLLFVKSPNGFD